MENFVAKMREQMPPDVKATLEAAILAGRTDQVMALLAMGVSALYTLTAVVATEPENENALLQRAQAWLAEQSAEELQCLLQSVIQDLQIDQGELPFFSLPDNEVLLLWDKRKDKLISVALAPVLAARLRRREKGIYQVLGSSGQYFYVVVFSPTDIRRYDGHLASGVKTRKLLDLIPADAQMTLSERV